MNTARPHSAGWFRALMLHGARCALLLGLIAPAQFAGAVQDSGTNQDQTGQTNPPAQDDGTVAPPAGEPDVERVTIEQVQARLDELSAIAEPDQPTRDAIGRLTDALSTLRLEAQERERAAESVRQRQAVPTQLQQVQAELDNPPTPTAPAPAPDATLDQLRQSRDEAAAAEQAANEQLAKLREDQATRRQRREAIPTERERLRVALEDAQEDIDAPPAAGDSAVLIEARRLLHLATKQYIEAQLASLDAEIANYDERERVELLPKRIRRWELRLDARQKETAAWRQLVTRTESERAATDVQEAEDELESSYEAIREIAAKNLELAQKRTAPEGVLNLKESTQRKLTLHNDDEIRALADQFAFARTRADALAGSQSYDAILRRLRDGLPDLNDLYQELRDLDNTYARIQLEQSDLEFELEQLGLQRDQVEQAAQSVDDIADPREMQLVRADIERLVSEQRTRYDTLIADYRALSNDLFVLQEHYREKIDIVERFRQFIDERILWIRSADPIRLSDFTESAEGLGTLFNPATWIDTGRDCLSGLARRPALAALLLIAALAGVGLRRWLGRIITTAADRLERPFGDRMLWTWHAFAATLALALVWPAVFWLVAASLRSAPQSSEFSLSVAAGLSRSAVILFVLESLRLLCRPRGMVAVHFCWNDDARIRIRRVLTWFTPIAVPLGFLVNTLEWQTNQAGNDPLSRFAFIAAMVVLSLVAFRVMHPTNGAVLHYLQDHKGGWLDRLRYLWFSAVIAVPLILAIAAGLGYYYTAIQVEHRVLSTVWMIIALIVIQGFAHRWLLHARRRIAIEEYRKKHAAAMARVAEMSKDGAKDAKTSETVQPEEPQIDINEIDAQARQLLRTVMTIALLVGLWLSWAQMVPALSALDRVELWPNFGLRDVVATSAEDAPGSSSFTGRSAPASAEQPANGNGSGNGAANANGAAASNPSAALLSSGNSSDTSSDPVAVPISDAVTLGDLIAAVIIVIVTVLLSRNLPGLLEMTLLQRLPLEPSGRYAVTTLARYVLVIVGTIMAFGAIGIGWSKVQWLAAAITVGLGFGLQEIFANFVSGIIILFEQPIRVGDTVTVGQVNGTVTRIRMRATTICDWDRKELVIPNKEFVTGQIINWSLTDPVLRVSIPVGIAYGSDTALAKKLLLEVAKKNPNVLEDPEPRALFTGFGDSSLDFQLRVFIPSIDHFIPIRDELHFAIDNAFRQHDIEIAFPQRDIHVRSVDMNFPVEMKAAAKGGE